MGGYHVHYTGCSVVLLALCGYFEAQVSHGHLRSPLTFCNHQGYAADLAVDQPAFCYSSWQVAGLQGCKTRYERLQRFPAA